MADKKSWEQEAAAVIKDVEKHVRHIEVSKKLISSNQRIYLNLRTLEDRERCIELSASGFRVVGDKFDRNDVSRDQYFETPYSLLDNISGDYKHAFGNELTKKLNLLLSKEKK